MRQHIDKLRELKPGTDAKSDTYRMNLENQNGARVLILLIIILQEDDLKISGQIQESVQKFSN